MVLPTRGGYGLTRLLPRLPYRDMAHAIAHGTLFVGLSDFTALQLALLAREGLDSFVSRVVFFMVVFGLCLLLAKLLYWLFDSAGLVHKRERQGSTTLSQV